MPALLTPADSAVMAVMRTVIEARYPDLIEADVRIEILMATSKDGKPAVKLHGVPAVAVIRVVKDEERCNGGPDVRIKVDATRHANLRPRQREALFRHELRHLIVVREDADDRKSPVRTDDYDRPLIRMRPDDYTINGFFDVHEEYGADSLEHAGLEAVREMLGQRTFDFGDDADEGADGDPRTLSMGGKAVAS